MCLFDFVPTDNQLALPESSGHFQFSINCWQNIQSWKCWPVPCAVLYNSRQNLLIMNHHGISPFSSVKTNLSLTRADKHENRDNQKNWTSELIVLFLICRSTFGLEITCVLCKSRTWAQPIWAQRFKKMKFFSFNECSWWFSVSYPNVNWLHESNLRKFSVLTNMSGTVISLISGIEV